jgi:shikimate dehydrogenase
MLHGFWLRTLGLPGAYEAVDVAPEALDPFMTGFRKAGFVGGNVTVPHKQAVFAFVDRVAPEAAAIGAVNTVWVEEGKLVGGNTDTYGFLTNMDEQAPGWGDAAGLAIVLGAGGAARAVVYSLLLRGLRVHVANRTGEHAEGLAAQFGARVTAGSWASLPRVMPNATVLVNTTVLGMIGAPPLLMDLTLLHRDAVVSDIVYVPLTTALLQDAASRGHQVVDGLGMLLHQAVPGFARWFGQTPMVTPELRALLAADIRAKT